MRSKDTAMSCDVLNNRLIDGQLQDNHKGKGEIGYHTISEFALDWYIGLSMTLISIFEFANSSLCGIMKHMLSKIKLKVKHHCMFAIYLHKVW